MDNKLCARGRAEQCGQLVTGARDIEAFALEQRIHYDRLFLIRMSQAHWAAAVEALLLACAAAPTKLESALAAWDSDPAPMLALASEFVRGGMDVKHGERMGISAEQTRAMVERLGLWSADSMTVVVWVCGWLTGEQ